MVKLIMVGEIESSVKGSVMMRAVVECGSARYVGCGCGLTPDIAVRYAVSNALKSARLNPMVHVQIRDVLHRGEWKIHQEDEGMIEVTLCHLVGSKRFIVTNEAMSREEAVALTSVEAADNLLKLSSGTLDFEELL